MPLKLSLIKTIPNSAYHPQIAQRQQVLLDTVQQLQTQEALNAIHELAKQNHIRWKQNSKTSPNKSIQVISGDWGEVTSTLAQQSGEIYAVLNMANAHAPGGGYREGLIAQEENIYRRTDCHFNVHDNELDGDRYNATMTQLINGENGEIYLDTAQPRVCIKNKERLVNNQVSGYENLDTQNYFLFYELKSAADDLRNKNEYSEASMRRKIKAQLDTLIQKKVRHVVLSAFGCGAFLNPADKVAALYKEELEQRLEYFDDVVFAIYHAGYGPNNFEPFKTALAPLCGPEVSPIETPSLQPSEAIPMNVFEESTPLPFLNNCSMYLLSLFISALGITAMALACLALTLATAGGITLMAVGVGLTIAGIGLFALRCTNKDTQVFNSPLEMNP